jgi:FkbM family methyltransferase
MKCSYLHKRFVTGMKGSSIKIIIECGSRDCLDAIELNNYYHPKIIYSFECNPESIPICEKNIEGYPNIKLIKCAAYDKNGVVDFYATDMLKSTDKNIGASSLLFHRDNKKSFIQKRIQVEAIRLDTFIEQEQITKIDLLCMDLQGAEHFAIKGFGDKIRNVKFIISEVSFSSYYHGDKPYTTIITMLRDKGFEVVDWDTKRRVEFGNVLLKNVG